MALEGRNRNSPIFIAGVHRSGTTLLRFMLSSNPRIYIPPESDFIPRFFLRQPSKPLSPQRVERLLEIIFTQYRFVKQWEGDRPRTEEFMLQMGDPTPTAFLDCLYRTYARQHGAIRWGDKTPIYTSYVSLLHQIFPAAQFVHIIRDGRDVALSTLEKWGDKEPHVDLYYAARMWVRRIHQARRAARQLMPSSYYEVHYEALVQDPEGELRSICDFLGETYVPQMAKQHRQARHQLRPAGFHAPVRQPPSPGRAGRWQREMSTNDLRLYQSVAGPLLRQLGYPVEHVGHMAPEERLRLARLWLKYEILQTGRRALQALRVFPPI